MDSVHQNTLNDERANTEVYEWELKVIKANRRVRIVRRDGFEDIFSIAPIPSYYHPGGSKIRPLEHDAA